jgi:hypothetical protein
MARNPLPSPLAAQLYRDGRLVQQGASPIWNCGGCIRSAGQGLARLGTQDFAYYGSSVAGYVKADQAGVNPFSQA